jgi:hypothetical protein
MSKNLVASGLPSMSLLSQQKNASLLPAPAGVLAGLAAAISLYQSTGFRRRTARLELAQSDFY